MKRTSAVILMVLSLVVGLLATSIGPGAESVGASEFSTVDRQSADTLSAAPVRGDGHVLDVKRGFRPAAPGEVGPELTFPGLTENEAKKTAEHQRELDARERVAMLEADRAYERAGGKADEPVLPRNVEGFVEVEMIDDGPVPDQPRLQPPARSGSGSGNFRNMSSCSGNCYQSDRANPNNHADDVYSTQFYLWIKNGQSNETNRCDGVANTATCFWFYAMNMSTDGYNTAFHIGPQRGNSLSGDAGSNWRMNIDGYENGVHVGGQSTHNLPQQKWMRIRTWRLATGQDSSAPYATWASWGIWVEHQGTNHYLGELTIEGHVITYTSMFAEIYEADGQCDTDRTNASFNNPRIRRIGKANYRKFAWAKADYEDNCSDTTWHSFNPADDYFADRRETTRVIAEGAFIFNQ